MRNPIVAVLGNVPHGAINFVAPEFGCAVETVDSFENLEQVYVRGNIVAVFFEPHAFKLSWHIALKSVLNPAPAALPIVCHQFSDLIDWPSLAEAGAFHTIPIPFNEAEVRQSLGFVWARYRTGKTVEMSKRLNSRVARAGQRVA